MIRLRQLMDVNFRAKVLIPVIIVMVLLLAVTVMVVNLRFQQQTVDNGRSELKAARLRFLHSLTMHQDKLRLCFKILANEPKYRAAFMNDPFDPPTVRDSLARMVEDEKLSEEGVEFVFFTRNDARPADISDPMIRQRDTSVSARDIMAGSDLAVRHALQGNPQPDTVRVGDKLYNVISIPVYYPKKSDGVLGALTFGEEMHWQSAQEFSLCASGLTVLIAGDQVVASTLAGNEPTEHLAGRFKQLTAQADPANATLAIQRIFIGNEHYFCSGGNFPSLKGDTTLGYLLFSSYEKQLQALATTRVWLLTVSLVAMLVSLGVVWFLVRKATEPLRELRDSVEAVGRGDFTRRVPVRANDECGELATVFNQMTGNLEQSRAQLEQTVQTLKSTQGQLIQSEKLSAVGEFVAGVAHELNNPLAAVVGFSEMLKDNDVDTKNRRYLDMIYKSAQRCQKIVQALLSFARRHQPERKPMSVNTMVEAVLEMLNYQLRTSNIEVVTQMDAALPVVLADGHQIQQVLLNVINNARQAMENHPSGGRIKIITETSGENVRIIIHDNGPGISEENLLRIFDPFFTTKKVGQGTGLGLSLCYGIIKEHGGNITPSSRPGDGAKFTIELPVFHLAGETVEALPATETKRQDTDEGAGKRILVIDDEEAILQMLREGLAQNGFSVDTVSDGEKALLQLRENRYDVTFCDWKMPGLNGRQIYERLRAINPGLCQRVVFFSGDVVNGQMREFLEQEKRPCLAKPFSFDEVRAAIGNILNA
ncbi:MAG: ATP-binding protein [Verrucomicrobiales bacterium]|nr:ATP-binding protein [Verrucomicrobiales bacterium]